MNSESVIFDGIYKTKLFLYVNHYTNIYGNKI